jgi:hypothetical protein
MKRLFTLFFGITLLTSTIDAQMYVWGDVLNTGDVHIVEDLIVNAEHNGTNPSNVGVIHNQADGVNKLTAGNLVLHSVSWNITHKNKKQGADGILVSNPEATDVPTIVAGAKVVKNFKGKGYYYFSLPFAVAAGGIAIDANSPDGITPNPAAGVQFYSEKNTTASAGYWLYKYDSDDRASSGLYGATPDEGNSNTGWVGLGDATSAAAQPSPALNAGQTYSIWVDKPGFYTFSSAAGATNTMFDKDKTTSSLQYQAKNSTLLNAQERYELNFGWHGIGTMQTAPFQLNSTNATHITGNHIGNSIYTYDYDNQVWKAVVFSHLDMPEEQRGTVAVSPYAGIFVQLQATVGHGNTTFATFAGAGRRKEAAAGHLRSSASSSHPYLGLKLHSSATMDLTDADALCVILKAGSSNDFKGGEDGLKYFGGKTSKTPEFGALVYNGANPVAVTNNFRVDFAENEEIPVSLWIKETGDYTITTTSIDGYDQPVYLVDKATATLTELLPDMRYDFQASATSAPVTDRFALRAGVSGTTGLPASVFNKILIYAADNHLYIKNATVGDNIAIYNLAGQLITSLTANAPEFSQPLPAKGVYVVKVSGLESVVTKIISK